MWTEITRAKYERAGRRYASDLADAEWRLIEPYMPAVKRLGRPRETDLRRVMSRLLRRAQMLPGAPSIWWRDRRRLAKKRARAIEYSRGQDEKRQLYGELIAAAQATLGELQAAVTGLIELAGAAARWRAQAEV